MDERFLYSVNPKRPIKNLPDVSVIRVPKSLYLSKEDVRICLQSGSVYRRFANESRNEKVNIANLDRLHNAKYMTEEEYKEFLQKNIDSNRGTVIGDKTSVEKMAETFVGETDHPQESFKEEQPAKVEEVKPEETQVPAPEVKEEQPDTKPDEVVTSAPENTEEVKPEETQVPAPEVKEEQQSTTTPEVQSEVKVENKQQANNNNNEKNYGGKNNRKH